MTRTAKITAKTGETRKKKEANKSQTRAGRSEATLAAQRNNRLDRRNLITRCAARLFSEKGYQATTMDDLSAVTKMNKGTIYYYYDSKAEILHDICISTAVQMATLLSPALKMEDSVAAMTHVIEVMTKWIAQNRTVVQVYSQESRYFKAIFDKSNYMLLREKQRMVMKTIYDVLKNGCESGQFRRVEVTYAGRFILGMLMWIHTWPEAEIDVDAVAHSTCDFVLGSLTCREENPKGELL